MAKGDNNLDRYFREKLEKHEEKPSALAWERLEQELGRKKTSPFLPFLRIAASLLLMMGIAVVVWQIGRTSEQTVEQMAEIEEIPGAMEESSINESLAMETVIPEAVEQPEINSGPKTAPPSSEKPSRKIQEAAPSTNLIAEERPERIEGISIEFPEIQLPEIRLDQTLAEMVSPDVVSEEDVNFRVIIKSSGIKEEVRKPNLIEGLENNVNKIGTFLGKVEQGFADLQDAKNNLFASNIPTRERN